MISGKTQLIGLFGWPVAHSFSPAMHNAALAQLGLDWVYVPFPVRVEDVATAVRALPSLNIRGVNVTVPHKQAVMPFLDEIEAGAQAIGAVNTIVVRRGGEGRGERGNYPITQLPNYQLHGYNTDWLGFLADLVEHGVAVAERDCVVLGAGGSARAVVYGLVQQGARVHLLARRVEQAVAVVAAIGSEAVSAAPLDKLPTLTTKLAAPLIVNTTPLGMTPHVDGSVWPDELPFPAQAVLYDLVYNPVATKIMQQAQAAGCQAINGLGMLIYQGVEALRLWTGQQPDVAVMREAVWRHIYGKD
ncbi:MAG: shikimate dehydrogenase [Ardenticatenaceae bacterium]|nr:shikimate dehydrogenase [Ardenticatenaceae bacterium]MCB8946235.1 shikimate dehydrogenase [Ardenticatenaceae bacterium]